MDTQMNLQNVSPSKISLFIGRRGLNLNKQVKFPSWKMFEALKKEGKHFYQLFPLVDFQLLRT